jgi:hypothetical protein
MKITIVAAILALIPASGFAQKWEFGADAGAGLLNNVAVTGAAGSATAGFAPGFTAGAFLGENLYTHFSGEIRYEYMESDLRLSGGGQSAQFSGASQAVHYDVVYHTSGEAPVHFFGAIGGGLKAFTGTGAEAAYQPLSQYGYFTRTTTMKPMLTASVGVMFRLSPKLSLRAEVRDFTSAFPTKVLTPPAGVSYGSLLNEIVPMVSLVYSK